MPSNGAHQGMDHGMGRGGYGRGRGLL